MGFFQDLLGGGGGSVSKYQNKLDQQANRTNALAQLFLDHYQENSRNGAYDPNAQIDLLKRDTAYHSGLDSQNAAASARTLGYRPGDSEPLVAQNAIGTKSALNYDQLANQIRTNARNANTTDLSNAAGGAGNLYGQGTSIYENQLQAAQQQQAQQGGIFGSLLQSVMPFIAPQAAGAKALLGAGTTSYYGGGRPGSYIPKSS